MSSLNDPTYLRIHQLVTDWLEGGGQDRVRTELNELLANDEQARRTYYEYMQESAGLRWQSMHSEKMLNDVGLHLPDIGPVVIDYEANIPSRAGSARLHTKYVLAVSLLVLAFVSYWSLFRGSSQDLAKVAGQPPAVGSNAGVSSVSAQSSGTNSANSNVANTDSRLEIATLTRIIQTQWRDKHEARDALSRLRAGEEIWLESGQAEILFDSGVEVVLTGPAHFKIESRMSASAEYGTFSARVGPRGKGFTIQTPSAEVVDLGTEFGLAVSRAGETEVAVFSGIVDLSYSDRDAELNTGRQRLNQGEAIRVGLNGQTHRVVSIDSERFPMAGSQWVSRSKSGAVIQAVGDNLRANHSRSFYRIVRGGFGEDATAFVDRGHQWNGLNESGIPEFLRGADYVMPFNDDKLHSTLEVTLVLAKPATVYLLFDNNMSRPEWLTKDFVDTDYDIGLDEAASKYRPLKRVGVGPASSIDDTFSIWRRSMPEGGPIVLGGVSAPEDKNRGYNMYGIVAIPIPAQELD